MKLSYEANGNNFRIPLGKVESRISKPYTKWLHFDGLAIKESAQLSETQVLEILVKVVQQTSAKIKVEFEEGIVLEFE
jgi:hypothetical protein